MGRLIAKCLMKALPVIKNLNVIEDCCFCFLPCFKSLTVDQLILQVIEKTLGHRPHSHIRGPRKSKGQTP
jgi:hypothetical protein